jgi:hypothetical protein
MVAIQACAVLLENLGMTSKEPATMLSTGQTSLCFIHAGGTSLFPLPGIVRGRSEPVKAICGRRATAPVELLSEREDSLDAMTDPARSRSWQLSGVGTRVAKDS